MNETTAEARLVAAGWVPPTETLRSAIVRREAFRSAIAGLKTRGMPDARPVHEALAASDRDGILTALVALAVSAWLDAQCQRPDTELTAWSATLGAALRDAIWAAAPAVLDSLAGVDPADSAYLRREAEAATSIGTIVGISGRPAPARPNALSMNEVMVAR